MDQIVFIILCIILTILFLLFKGYRKYEETVCDEVCAIYSNTIVFIDQLCGVNNDILISWHKFCLKKAMKGERSYLLEKKLIEEIKYRKNEIIQMNNNIIKLALCRK